MGELPTQISVQELAAWRDEGRAFTLLDVREPWELEICRFADSLTIPLHQLPGRLADVPKDVPLVVLCHHGGRSAQAVSWLRRNGVDSAINLDGGIDSWAREIDRTMGVY